MGRATLEGVVLHNRRLEILSRVDDEGEMSIGELTNMLGWPHLDDQEGRLSRITAANAESSPEILEGSVICRLAFSSAANSSLLLRQNSINFMHITHKVSPID